MSLPKFEELLKLWWVQAREHALVALDVNGVIVAWGGEAEEVFGYGADEAIGQSVDVLFVEEDIAAGVPTKEREIARSGVPAEDDRWMRRRDGSRFWATGVLHSLHSDDGKIIGFAKVLRNRTDLKGQIESQRREIERLRINDGRKNQFIATLSHELRNPLTALATAAEILKLNPDDSTSRDFALNAIERQVAFSRRLIDDLLDLTRIHRGKLQLRRSLLDLRDVLKSSADAVEAQILGKSQTLHQVLGNDPVEVMADADRLQQIFVNLLQNASKYTPTGGDIWLNLYLEGNEAVVKIEDNGIGIPADILPQIFDLFAQAETSTEHSAGGLGVGLSVVKDLVRMHGGTVVVRSDGAGHGSQFGVRLPLASHDQPRSNGPKD